MEYGLLRTNHPAGWGLGSPDSQRRLGVRVGASHYGSGLCGRGRPRPWKWLTPGCFRPGLLRSTGEGQAQGHCRGRLVCFVRGFDRQGNRRHRLGHVRSVHPRKRPGRPGSTLRHSRDRGRRSRAEPWGIRARSGTNTGVCSSPRPPDRSHPHPESFRLAPGLSQLHHQTLKVLRGCWRRSGVGTHRTLGCA